MDARIRIVLYTLTSLYQNLLTNLLRCPDTNRIRVDSGIRSCGRRYFSIRIKKIADTKISGYVWTGPKEKVRIHREGVSNWRFNVLHYLPGLSIKGPTMKASRA